MRDRTRGRPGPRGPTNDPMPATETLAGVSTVRQDQINQLKGA